MRNRFNSARVSGAIAAMAVVGAVVFTAMPIAGQAPAPAAGQGRAAGAGRGAAAPAQGRGTAPARPARIAGRPNINGIYQAINTANWNLEDHSASDLKQFWQLGAIA